MSTKTDTFFAGLFADLLPGRGTYPEPPDTVPLRILGLTGRPASQEAVKSAFRARLLVVHPDAGAYAAVPVLQDAADALAMGKPEVAELAWARDVLLRKIPPSDTADERPRVNTYSRNGWLTACRACEQMITGWPGRPAARGHRWPGYCQPCADVAENARQRDLRRQRRADRTCTCGEAFTPQRSDGRYCSPACRQKAYRARQAGGAA